MTITKAQMEVKRLAEREAKMREAFTNGLLKDLESDEATARRAALKIYNDRALEKLDVLQAELDAIKKSAEETVPRTEHEAALTAERTARAATEKELQELKNTYDATLDSERSSLKNKTADIELREHRVQVRIDEAKQKFEASGLADVIKTLQKMVRLGERTEPDFFKASTHHPLFWATFWDEEKAAIWCRLVKDKTFDQNAAVNLLHRGTFCSYCGWNRLKTAYSDEAAAYARAFLASKGWTQEQIGSAVRQLIESHDELDAKRPRPTVYDLMDRSPKNPRIERREPRPMIERAPAFVPDYYPYCGNGGTQD